VYSRRKLVRAPAVGVIGVAVDGIIVSSQCRQCPYGVYGSDIGRQRDELRSRPSKRPTMFTTSSATEG